MAEWDRLHNIASETASAVLRRPAAQGSRVAPPAPRPPPNVRDPLPRAAAGAWSRASGGDEGFEDEDEEMMDLVGEGEGDGDEGDGGDEDEEVDELYDE